MSQFELSDFPNSDGIGECEEIITKAGGYINKFIIRVEEKDISDEVSKAINYLCNEWDYGYESI